MLLEKSVEEIKEKLSTYDSKEQLEDDFKNWGKLILNRIDNYASIIIPNFNEDKEEDLINDIRKINK